MYTVYLCVHGSHAKYSKSEVPLHLIVLRRRFSRTEFSVICY